MSTTEESYESEHDPIDHRVRDRYFKPHAQALLHFLTYSMSPGTIAKLKPALTCHVAAVFIAACCRNWYYDLRDRYEARKMGARVVPVVKGRWPGNLDVLLKFKKATASEYLGDFFLSLFEEHQSTIVNLRMLGANLVSRSLTLVYGLLWRYPLDIRI